MGFSTGDKGRNIIREGSEFWDPKKLRQLVLMDDLTGLFNRRYFRLRLDEEGKRCQKHGTKFSLIMLDVNGFKEINDLGGHLVGDTVLVHIGYILRGSVREEDIVCRWAGDEFVVILPEAGEEETERVAGRIVTSVRDFQWEEKCEGKVGSVSISLGYAVFPDDAADLVTLIENADRALYAAKKSGKPQRVKMPTTLPQDAGRRESGPVVYGKQEELRMILSNIRRIERGVPQFIVIRGEMGVGKTFIVERVEAEAKKMKMMILRVRCNEESSDTPLFPFKELFNHYMAQDRAQELISSVDLPQTSYAELGRFFPRWMRSETRESIIKIDSGRDRFILFEAFSQFLLKLSEKMGVVVFVEDVQWADVASLALLHFLARTIYKGRMGIILTSRVLDDAIEPWKGSVARRELASMEKEGHFQRIQLSPLSKRDSIQMIKDLFGENDLSEDSIEELYRITDGNPFYIREMAQFLSKSEELTRDLNQNLPPTIHEAIGHRIEKLSPEAKSAFQAASVLGKEFEFDILLNILNMNEGHLLDIMDEGIASNLIAEVPDFRGDRYSFTQNVIWKLLYSGVPTKIKSAIHCKAGVAIEQYDREGIEERYSELAHHFELGGDNMKALEYSLKSAKKAGELFAHEEAISYYGKALKLVRSARTDVDRDILLQIHEQRGIVYQQIGDYRRAERDFEKVLEIASSPEGRDRLGYALKNLSNISIFKREFKKAYEYSLRTLRHAIETGDIGLKAESLAAFGNIYLFSGEYERARNYYLKALEMDERNHDRLRVSKIYTNLGVIHWYKEEYSEALKLYQKALEILRELGNKTLQPLCVNNIAMISLQQGLFLKALKLCEEAMSISRETGNKTIEAYSNNNIGEIYQRIGDYRRALEWSKKAVMLIKRIKDKGSRADFMRNRGVDYYYLGETQKAMNDLKKALVLSRSSGKKEYEMNDLFWLIKLLVEEGKIDEAHHRLVDFEELISSRVSKEYSLKFALSSATVHLAEGNTANALRCIEGTKFEPDEVDPYLAMMYLYKRADVLFKAGREEEGRREVEQAWKVVQSLSRKLRDRALRETFLRSHPVASIRKLLKPDTTSLQGSSDPGAGGQRSRRNPRI
ncbi:MAG: BREX system ATP-binding domain-containing protein [Candidatus Glassbacteria bacterium]